jgi:hypothetical protein
MRKDGMRGLGLLTEQKHLDLIALKHFVPLQLVLDLLIPGLALLLLGAHTATHLDSLLGG